MAQDRICPFGGFCIYDEKPLNCDGDCSVAQAALAQEMLEIQHPPSSNARADADAAGD